LSLTTYLRLANVFNALRSRYSLTGNSVSVNNFWNKFKKGSKNLRKILDGNTSVEATFNQFLEVNNLAGADSLNFEQVLGLWNYHGFSNNFREFIFKFFHNRLQTNTRMSHYVDKSRWCTFCAIVGKNFGPFAEESFTHLFSDCPTVKKIQEDFEGEFLELAPDPLNIRWFGVGSENLLFKAMFLSIQYQIWQAKIQNRIPDFNFCIGEAIYLMDYACKHSKKFSNLLNSLNCPLSRLWTRLTQPRW
jgi:hypothetical protein